MSLKAAFSKVIEKLPGIDRMESYFARHPRNPFLRFSPPGHFYSPIPDLKDVEKSQDRIYASDTCNELHGLDLRMEYQRDLLRQFQEYRHDCPFVNAKTGLRYFPDNSYFSIASAVLLYNMLVHLRPKRVVEVGSGFSSAVMLDTNQYCALGVEQFTFIDPYPERLQGLLTSEDRKHCRVMQENVQTISDEVFESLEANDLLFIDSSHVVKSGSDVVHLFSRVIPRVKRGVVVHVHDVYWPFEYPIEWLRQGICWNETYLVKSFLQFNDQFKIVLFNDYCFKQLPEPLDECLKLPITDAGSSIFFQRVAG